MRTMTFAGKSLTDFSCFWDTSQVFRKPAKRVSSYAIPAHNGNYLIPDKSFDNVTIIINCFIKDNYEQNYSDLVNYLNSFDTYQRLETSAEPNIFRMAMLHASIEPETGQFLKDGRFTLEFDCKPQEFLVSGETEITITNPWTVLTGNPLTIDNTSGAIIQSMARVFLEPSQTRTGSAPWPITGLTEVTTTNTNGRTTDTYTVQFHTGKNLLNYPVWKTDGITGGSATWTNNGVRLTANSTDCYTNYEAAAFPTSARIAVSTGDVLIMTWELTGTAAGQAYIFGNGATSSMASAQASARYLTYTVPSGVTFVTYRVGVRGSGNSLTYSNVMIRKSNTEGSFEAYGTTGLSTIYGGDLNLHTGRLTVTMDVIEYYNGQTIGEPWLSTLDTYTPGGTPTTGAKVVYTLPTSVTYDFTLGSRFELLNGENTITTTASYFDLRYYAPAEVMNPTRMEAQPLLIIEDDGTVYINGEEVASISNRATFPLYIDTETMDAYALVNGEMVNMNGQVTLSDDLIKLKPGSNLIYCGNDSMKLVPRWWRL